MPLINLSTEHKGAHMVMFLSCCCSLACPREHMCDVIILGGNLTAQRCWDQVLQPVLVLFLQQHPPCGCFTRTIAVLPAVRAVQASLDQEHIQTLCQPPFSPDMCPTQHTWDLFINYQCTHSGLERDFSTTDLDPCAVHVQMGDFLVHT